MSEVVDDARQEFWRPPTSQLEPASGVLAEACTGCSTEFMIGAGFCHVCGNARQIRAESATNRSWIHYLQFQNIKQGLGLSTGSLVAFLLGLGCLLAVVAVGMINTMQSLADFQAIQFYRLQWLLAAVAAFVAGILLKKAGPSLK